MNAPAPIAQSEHQRARIGLPTTQLELELQAEHVRHRLVQQVQAGVVGGAGRVGPIGAGRRVEFGPLPLPAAEVRLRGEQSEQVAAEKVREVGGVDTLAELTEKLRKDQEEIAEREARRALHEVIVARLI